MRKWLVLSSLLHLLVFLLVWLGLPRIHEELEPTQIIPVDIADISQVTAVKKAPEQKAEPKPEPKPQPKPPEPPKPPPAPEVKQELRTPTIKEAEPEPTPLPKPKPKPVKPEPPKPDTLASILKNVAKMKPQEQQPEKPTPQKEPAPAPSPPQVPATAEHLTMSEADALRRQMAQCWNVPIGARDVQNISVDIYIAINEDRTVREAVVVDQARMASDSFFRAVAESAIRALHNPLCSPLALPPEKYQEWKDTIMTFNPKDMF